MAIRKIVLVGNNVLKMHCRQITDFNDRTKQLLDDLGDTLSTQDGVGLAAPQVGVLRRCVVVLETNVPEWEKPYIIELVNPEIIEKDGEQTGAEGCLSLPGQFGVVTRPEHVTVRAQDRDGNTFEVEGIGLTARCFCHEIDHLDGVLFTERAERMLSDEELEEL